MGEQSFDTQQIAAPTKTADLPQTAGGQQRSVTEALPRVDVAQVHFDHRDGDALNGVSNGDGGMGVCSCVEDHPICPLWSELQGGDELSFMVALLLPQFDILIRKMLFRFQQDIRQGSLAVDFRFALAQQIQIRPVQDQDFSFHRVTWLAVSSL